MQMQVREIVVMPLAKTANSLCKLPIGRANPRYLTHSLSWGVVHTTSCRRQDVTDVFHLYLTQRRIHALDHRLFSLCDDFPSCMRECSYALTLVFCALGIDAAPLCGSIHA